MFKKLILFILTITVMAFSAELPAQDGKYEIDKYETANGELAIWFIGHGTLMFEIDGYIVHIDPVRREGDYSTLPGADLILITHSHGDHLDPAAVKMISTDGTEIVCNKKSAPELSEPVVLSNGDTFSPLSPDCPGIKITAIPAYNIIHERSPGVPFHPKGEGNGYLLDTGGKRIYIAGDTEDIPEMAGLKDIDIAFLPMNLPYTMSPEMAARAALSFKPRVLYPYHYGSTNTSALVKLIEGSGIEVKIRKL